MSSSRQSFFLDLRFIIGVVLVIVAVAGVWGVVSAARATTTVWVAAHTLVPGDVLAGDDLLAVEVGLGEAEELYASAGSDLSGAVANRVIAAGEVVPLAALGTVADAASTAVVIEAGGTLAAAVVVGADVELWATDTAADDTRPHVIVADAVVASVETDGTGMISSGTQVELIIPRAAITEVLQAQAAGAVLAVVPTGGAR